MKSWRSTSIPLANWIRFGTAFLLLNVPFWVIGHWLFMSRPIINVELVLPLLIAAWSLPAAALSLTFVWLVDFTASQAPSFHFPSTLEFLSSASFLSDVNLTEFVSPERAMFVLPFIACAALALRWRPRPAPWLPALTVFALLSLLDIANGSSLLRTRGTRLISANIANGPTIMLSYRAWEEKHQPTPVLAMLPVGTSATSLADVDQWTAAHPNGSVLVLLVESMGLHRDPLLRSWLRDQLFGAATSARYTLRETTIPFQGSTTSAELRELCELTGSYRSLTTKNGHDCLPSRLAAQGWHTIGLHGFSSRMFGRRDWWQKLGFQTQRFAEDFPGVDERRCGGAFSGLCDAPIVRMALAQTVTQRSFVYALTLNSHLPIAPIELPSELVRRCDAVAAGPNVCQLTATIAIALRALRDGLATSRPATQVIVVGDHAPPFSSISERAQYSQQEVPAFILTPR